MIYVVGTLGIVPNHLKSYTPIWQQFQKPQHLRHHKEVGFYSLFFFQGRSHLVACINPHGGSTIATDQFLNNRRTFDLQPGRIMPWLLGKESLLDKRCLWVHLSLPQEQVSVATTYSVLEQVWWSWYRWWSPRFPRH